MSLFLGYIHHLMFSKIKFLDSLVAELAAREPSIKSKVDEIGIIEDGELQDIIDESNIHGWLDERVNLVEKRFAVAVSEFLKSGHSEDEILEILRDRAKSENFSGNASAAYQKMTSLFLDGMPCDGGIGLVENEDDKVVFQISSDLHKAIWDEYEGADLYWRLRDEFVDAMISPDLSLKKIGDGMYEIN